MKQSDKVDANMRRMRSPNCMDASLATGRTSALHVARTRFDSQVTRAELVAKQGISLQCARMEPCLAKEKDTWAKLAQSHLVKRNQVIDAPDVANRATRTLSADSRTASAQHLDEVVTCELCASLLEKLSEFRVVTFQNRLKTKQMLEMSGL